MWIGHKDEITFFLKALIVKQNRPPNYTHLNIQCTYQSPKCKVVLTLMNWRFLWNMEEAIRPSPWSSRSCYIITLSYVEVISYRLSLIMWLFHRLIFQINVINTTIIFGGRIGTPPSGSLLKCNIITQILTPFHNRKVTLFYGYDSRFYCSVIQDTSK